MDTTFTVRGSVAVVTGASSGLGRRMALDLAAYGAVVTGIARREEPLRALADEMQRSSPESGFVVCDVSETDRFASVLADIEARQGRIDLLINDAGIGEPTQDGIAKYRTVLETNFFGAVAGTLAVLPGMLERRHGVVVNVSSDTGRAPGPGEPAYAASKAALSAFTESLSYEVEDRGVHLHVLYPGFVPTPMTRARPIPARCRSSCAAPRRRCHRRSCAGSGGRGWRSTRPASRGWRRSRAPSFPAPIAAACGRSPRPNAC